MVDATTVWTRVQKGLLHLHSGTRLVKVENECNSRTHLLGPGRCAVSTCSATMVRTARSCSGRMPEEENELTADTFQSGHLEGEPGVMRSAGDVICRRSLEDLGFM